MTYRMTFLATTPGPIPPQRRQPGQYGAPDSPIRDDFPDGPAGADAYVLAWKIWLQQQADGRLTRGEAQIRAELYAEVFDVPVLAAAALTLHQLRQFAKFDPAIRALIIAAILKPVTDRDFSTHGDIAAG